MRRNFVADSKKYYYLKLKDSFFDREEIKILESQPNGIIYSNLYLKLCLMSLKGDGRLLFRDEIPYDEQMIATVTNIPLDNVRAGLVVLRNLGLIIRIDSGEIYMSEIQTMIGRTSTEGDRKKIYRDRIKNNNEITIIPHGQLSENVPRVSLNRTPEREIELEKEIEREREDKPHNKRKAFSRPNLPDIIEYMIEKGGNDRDAERFYNYYESVNWFVGKKKMANWKAAASGWLLRESEHRKQSGEQPRSYAEYKKMMGISQ